MEASSTYRLNGLPLIMRKPAGGAIAPETLLQFWRPSS